MLLGVLFLLASMPFAAAAQPAAFPGQPLDGVALTVENVESGKVAGRGITGNDGFVRFYDIPGGSYRIVARGLAKAIDKLAVKTGKVPPAPVTVAPTPARTTDSSVPTVPEPALTVEQLAPPPPDPAPPAIAEARSSLSMPSRPSAVVVRMVAPGTTREARTVDTLLAEGVELLAFSVPVSGPLSVQLRHEEH